MACVTKCDRCGKYFDWHHDDTDGFAFLSHNYKREFAIKKDYDLCPDCVRSLRYWIEVEKKGLATTIAEQYMG